MNTPLKVAMTAVIGLSAWAFVSMFLMGARPFSEVRAFEVECGSSATQVRISGVTGFDMIECQNPTNNVVYFGGSSVGTRGGFPVCSDTRSCANASIKMDANLSLYCVRGALADVSIRCISGR